jgi:hypothetical protein
MPRSSPLLTGADWIGGFISVSIREGASGSRRTQTFRRDAPSMRFEAGFEELRVGDKASARTLVLADCNLTGIGATRLPPHRGCHPKWMLPHTAWQIVLYGAGNRVQSEQRLPGASCDGATVRPGADGGIREVPRSWPRMTGAVWIGKFMSLSIGWWLKACFETHGSSERSHSASGRSG